MKGEGCLYSAYEIMKTIRLQAGGINFDLYLDEVAQSKDSFRKLIQNERRLEFAFENHRYFDMRRWVLPLNEEWKELPSPAMKTVHSASKCRRWSNGNMK